MHVKRVFHGALVAALVVISCWNAPVRAEISQKLKDGLSANSPKVRIVAAMGVAKTKDATSRVLLEPLLKDSDASVRAAVVEALGAMRDPAAIPAMEPLVRDPDATVVSVVNRVLPALRALQVTIYIGEVKDLSNSGMPNLGAELRRKVKAAITQKLGSGFVITEDATQRAYGANPIILRSVGRTKDGNNSFIELKCELTLVEMPQNILRAALASTAAVGMAGEIPKKLEPELASDALTACAPELAGDFAAYVKERARR